MKKLKNPSNLTDRSVPVDAENSAREDCLQRAPHPNLGGERLERPPATKTRGQVTYCTGKVPVQIVSFNHFARTERKTKKSQPSHRCPTRHWDPGTGDMVTPPSETISDLLEPRKAIGATEWRRSTSTGRSDHVPS